MGARFYPSLANIFMGAWDELFLFSEANPFSPHIRWYGRYIDDLLLMWGGTDNMNLNFTFQFSLNVANFLDVTLVGDPNKGVVISPFRKNTATNSTLLA